MQTFGRQSKKIAVGIIGGLVVLVGIVMIPYPGPGWLVVFAGLAILATEFTFASRLLHFAKGKYNAWVRWLKHQHIAVRIVVLCGTGVVVVATLWIVNAFGISGALLGLPYEWLTSPLFR